MHNGGWVLFLKKWWKNEVDCDMFYPTSSMMQLLHVPQLVTFKHEQTVSWRQNDPLFISRDMVVCGWHSPIGVRSASHDQCEKSCTSFPRFPTALFYSSLCWTHDNLKVHDVYIWSASGRISTFTAPPVLSQGIWLRWLTTDSHMCLRGPVILLKV